MTQLFIRGQGTTQLLCLQLWADPPGSGWGGAPAGLTGLMGQGFSVGQLNWKWSHGTRTGTHLGYQSLKQQLQLPTLCSWSSRSGCLPKREAPGVDAVQVESYAERAMKVARRRQWVHLSSAQAVRFADAQLAWFSIADG